MTVDEWLFDSCRCVRSSVLLVAPIRGHVTLPLTRRYEEVDDVRAALDAGANTNAGQNSLCIQ